MKHDHTNHEKVMTNFKKAQSLINRIQKMQDDGIYCIDIMHQNLAVIGLLKSAHQLLMADHLKECFSEAMKSDDDQTKSRMIEEILTVTKLLSR